MEPVQLAAILAGAALVASMISVEVGISVALIELALGVVLGNIFSLDPNQSWLVFIASFASVVLTFLAGAEVDPDDFRERFWPAVGIGLVSFAGPFVLATAIAQRWFSPPVPPERRHHLLPPDPSEILIHEPT